MESINVKELAVKTREAMRASGMTEGHIWKQYNGSLLSVVRWFRKNGHQLFSADVAYDYLNEIEQRKNRGEIGGYHYSSLRRGTERMMEVFENGVLSCNSFRRGSRYKLNDYYENLLPEFTASEKFSKKTLGGVTWVARKFFSWLIESGHNELAKVGVDEIQKFVIDCSVTMKSTSIHNVKLYLKKLCGFLHKRGLLPNSYEGLLSFRVSRESKQLPATPPEEIAAVFNLIDRSEPKGKRDYAMFMLAVAAGVRAVDIMKLKLTDIDWRKGEINIIQAKTGQNLRLPLTADIGEALEDYILNGRQKVNEPEVFLRHKPPYRAFADAAAIGDIYDEYRKAAGYERAAFDGKGFHSLRRTAGTNLVTADISLTDAAQLLGKINPRSMKKYIALDTAHLKECALDFADIDEEVTV